MPLPPGTQLGSYKIIALLGAGGMGEVYRARDPDLGREVAVKVLPPGFGGDPARVRRFEQEARALAALNHRNVLADVRSDIFAFGVVLYEMLSGTGAFRRSGTIETLHATLHETPPELTSASGPVPPALQRLVEHCLEKDPDRRFQHVQDLLYDLEADFAGHPSAGATTRNLPVVKGRRRGWLAAAGAVVLALMGGLLLMSPWVPKPAPYDPRCVTILPFENHTGEPGLDPLGMQARDRIRQLLQLADRLKIAADPAPPPGGEAAALHNPYLFGENTYHRAAIAAQLGEKDRAVALLGQAFAEGVSYYNEEWHLDINLEPLHGYAPYEELVRPKG